MPVPQPVPQPVVSPIVPTIPVGFAPPPTAAGTPAAAAVAPGPTAEPPSRRAVADQEDERSGPLVHVVYAAPLDGDDRGLDERGVIADSLEEAQRWLKDTGGLRVRFDTFEGSLDISFLRLSETEAQLEAAGARALNGIQEDLADTGFGTPGKIYLVYVDGPNPAACGNSAWPPTIPGFAAALYLHGSPSGIACDAVPLTSSGGGAGYWEHSALHEILHLGGFAPACAPHHVPWGHVSDSPHDLMYAGPQPWVPTELDTGRDDYFQASIPGCADLARSPYFEVAG